MPEPNDLSRSLVALDQDSAIIASGNGVQKGDGEARLKSGGCRIAEHRIDTLLAGIASPARHHHDEQTDPPAQRSSDHHPRGGRLQIGIVRTSRIRSRRVHWERFPETGERRFDTPTAAP
jgi:hypothetical protein